MTIDEKNDLSPIRRFGIEDLFPQYNQSIVEDRDLLFSSFDV